MPKKENIEKKVIIEKFNLKIWELLEHGRHSYRMMNAAGEDELLRDFHHRRIPLFQQEICDLLEVRAAITGESCGTLLRTTPNCYSEEPVTKWWE